MPRGPITGVSQDTRSLEPGNLYVAIRGERHDGHDFLAQAFAKGASGALVDEHVAWTANPVLAVPDPVESLQALARGYRKTWSATVVGITGSVGKTTVKEMCADVLSVAGPTHRTQGNLNNHIGLPLTMLRMPADARYGVFEIGMNHPGEIGRLADLLSPKIAVITDIGGAHLEHFRSVEEIAVEKARLAERVPGSGLVIVDRDSEWYALVRRRTTARVATISLGGVADHVGHPAGEGFMQVEGHAYAMPLPGDHMMKNALRAIALGLEMHMAPEKIAEGLGRFKLPPMRWEESLANGVHFINDAYNANPLSMRAVLRTFDKLPVGGAKWAVVGGMREMGESSQREHVELGRFIDTLAFDGVVAVGELGRDIVCRQAWNFFHAPTAPEAAAILKRHLRPGDHVLLKASRGERLERVLECFKEI